MSAQVYLTIDEVWLDGITPSADLSALLAQELQALCQQKEVLAALQQLPGTEIARIDGGRLGSGAARGPAGALSLGQDLAAIVTRSLLDLGTSTQHTDSAHSQSPAHSQSVGLSCFGSKEQP